MVKLVLNSAKRDNRSTTGPEDYFITMFTPVKNIMNLGLEAALVPKSNYPVILSFNSKFGFNEGAGDLEAQLVLQNYSGAQLASALKTAMDTAGADTYTVTYDAQTNRLTIASTGTWQILAEADQNEPGIYELLGFDRNAADTALTASKTSDTQVNLSYPNHLLLDVDLGTSQGFTEGVWTKQASYTFVVPFGGSNFGDFEYYTKNSVFQQVDATTDMNALKIRIRFRPPDDAAIDFPGTWSFHGIDHVLVFDAQQAF